MSRAVGSSRRFGERRSEVLIFIALCPKSAHMKGFIGSRTWPRPEQYTMYLPKHSRETWDRDGLGRLAQTRIEGLFFENPFLHFFPFICCMLTMGSFRLFRWKEIENARKSRKVSKTGARQRIIRRDIAEQNAFPVFLFPAAVVYSFSKFPKLGASANISAKKH